jgi:hypothetical protein
MGKDIEIRSIFYAGIDICGHPALAQEFSFNCFLTVGPDHLFAKVFVAVRDDGWAGLFRTGHFNAQIAKTTLDLG